MNQTIEAHVPLGGFGVRRAHVSPMKSHWGVRDDGIAGDILPFRPMSRTRC